MNQNENKMWRENEDKIGSNFKAKKGKIEGEMRSK